MKISKIKKIWKNKEKILEGLMNSLNKKEYIEQIAESRLTICQANTCGYYNPEGDNDKCIVKGSPCCAACGCKLDFKLRSLSSSCGLSEVDGKTPLWDAYMNQNEEDKLNIQ